MRDRQVELDLVARGQLRLQLLDQRQRARRGGDQPPLDVLGRVEHDELLLERPRETPPPEIPAVELLQEPGRAPLAQLADGLADEEDELGDDLLAGRLAALSVDDLAERPRVALGAAADHDRRRAGGREHSLRLGARGDVAGGDHGHVDERDELRGERVVGGTGVHLLRRARMERQRRRAGVDELRADLEARPRAVAQPAAHLHADRHVDGVRHRLHDRRGTSGLVEQRRAGAGLRHLADGAAEVDVDEVGAGGLDHSRRIGHRPWLRAEDLDRERVLVGRDPEVAERLLVPVLDPGAADHLRADEPGAEAASLAAKRLHADARHRRQDEPRGDLHVADVPAFAQVDFHGLLMVLTGIDRIRSCRYHSRPRRRVTAGFCLREAR